MKYAVLSALCLGLGACASAANLESSPPDYVVRYADAEPAAVMECVKARLVKEIALGSHGGGIEGDHAYLIGRGHRLVGSAPVAWVANFYADRAEVHGRPSLIGSNSAHVRPYIEGCTTPRA